MGSVAMVGGMQSGIMEVTRVNSIMLMNRYKGWVQQEDQYIN